MSLSRRFSNYKLVCYIPEDYIDMVQDYVKQCKQTSQSASNRIIQFIEEDSRAISQVKASVNCDRCKKALATRYVKFVSGKRLWVCDKCYEHGLSHNLVRDVLQEKAEKEEEHFNPNLHGAKGLEKV